MELKGKTFDMNGTQRKVSNTDADFAYFEDGSRIKKDVLITKYEEVMNPADFFNNTSSIQNLAQEVKQIDTNVIMNEETKAVHVAQVVTESPAVKIENKPTHNSGNDFFSKIKRNNTITIDFSIEEKFPSLDFVRMMNDNYETSIIDHFAQEMVEKIVFDPEALLESIKKRLNEIVYGEENNTKKGNKKNGNTEKSKP